MRFGLDPASGLPGIKSASDLGRLEIIQCYFRMPFKTVDRFFAGFGLNYDQPICQKLIEGNPMNHSHNIFIQVWSIAGLFGLIGLGFFVFLFLHGWLQSRSYIDGFDSIFWKTAAFYIVLQSIVDVSILHWPLSVCVTAFCLSVCLQRSSSPTSFVGNSMTR